MPPGRPWTMKSTGIKPCNKRYRHLHAAEGRPIRADRSWLPPNPAGSPPVILKRLADMLPWIGGS